MAKQEDGKIVLTIDAEALAVLKRIADALDRQNPILTDMDFGQVTPRFMEPGMAPPQHPGTIATPTYRTGEIGKWGEGDWVLEDEDHTGEETE